VTPRRVLMTTDAVGGVWTYALDLSAGLASHGVEVWLANLGPAANETQRAAARATPGLRFVETGLPLDWMCERPADIAAAAAAIRRLAERAQADLVHLNSPALAEGARFDGPVVGFCHSCLATWWAAVKDGPMPADFRWRAQALRRGLMACDALGAPSRSFAEATAGAHEAPLPFVAPNGRRDPGAPPGFERDALCFTSGRLWDEGKNLAVLDAAAAQLEPPVVAAGPLRSPDGRAAFAPRHLRTIGPLPASEVRAWLARASVYASAALYEPFGLGVLEAAQAGCALVLSDIPTVRELWDGVACFVGPRDADGFAGAIGRLLADPPEAERMGGLAQAAAQRLTPEAMTASALELYGLALNSAGARREAAA
jgi:glycosyltransferase involved in cell wall biosynthesis